MTTTDMWSLDPGCGLPHTRARRDRTRLDFMTKSIRRVLSITYHSTVSPYSGVISTKGAQSGIWMLQLPKRLNFIIVSTNLQATVVWQSGRSADKDGGLASLRLVERDSSRSASRRASAVCEAGA